MAWEVGIRDCGTVSDELGGFWDSEGPPGPRDGGPMDVVGTGRAGSVVGVHMSHCG